MFRIQSLQWTNEVFNRNMKGVEFCFSKVKQTVGGHDCTIASLWTFLQFAENNVPKHVFAVLFLDCLHFYMFLRRMSHTTTTQLEGKAKKPHKAANVCSF